MRKLDTSEHAFLLRALTDAQRLAAQDAKNYLAAAKVYEPVLPGSHTREAEQAVARGEWLTRFIAELEATEVHVGGPAAWKKDDGARPVSRPDGIPTRADIQWMTAAELAIREAMQAVEAAGASVALTDAVMLLSKAQNRVADHVEGRWLKATEVHPCHPVPLNMTATEVEECTAQAIKAHVAAARAKADALTFTLEEEAAIDGGDDD